MLRGRPKKTALEPTVKPLESGRIGIPGHFATATGWIQGTEDIEAFLVMLTLGRYRLVSATEASEDSDFAALKDRIESSSRDVNSSALDFQEDSIATLGVRLIKTNLSPSGTEWRLTLPAVVTQILRTHPKRGSALLLMAGRYIEVWDTEVYRASFNTPLDEIVQ
jgi:hypothetical protein